MSENKKSEKLAGPMLKKLRHAAGLGIKPVAALVDVTAGYLSKVENGYKIPTRALVERLCHVYGTPADAVVSELGELPRDVELILHHHKKEAFDLLRTRYAPITSDQESKETA